MRKKRFGLGGMVVWQVVVFLDFKVDKEKICELGDATDLSFHG